MSDLLLWLRSTIEGDKALAEAVKDPAEISMGAEYVDNCGSDEAAEHIRRHDHRDTIARCEAELALLDKLTPVLRQLGEIAYSEGQGAEHPDKPGEYIADEAAEYLVELLAAGYRHRPGFKPEWVSG